MDLNLVVVLAAVLGAIVNGILLPVLLQYIKKLETVTKMVVVVKEQEKNSMKQIDNLLGKVEELLRETSVHKESLNHIKDEIITIRKKVHGHASILMALELKLGKLENRIELNEK